MTNSGPNRLFLSPPDVGVIEREAMLAAFNSRWIAPVGPDVDAFEDEFAERIGARHALALSSGTAALHLALREVGVGSADDVVVSDLTFVASVSPILYQGSRPVLVGSERTSWNMDPNLLEDALRVQARKGRRPAAVVLVHLYGQSADLSPIEELCERYEVPLVEDAAEALGATHRGREGREAQPGVRGRCGIFSFNGNKIITTSGGGMLVSEDGDLIAHARKLATQARDPAPHYEHSELGYNYGLSNLLAAVGRGQLRVLNDRVAARRRVFARYRQGLGGLPGIEFQPEAPWGRHTRWLTCLTIDPEAFGADREAVRTALEARNIEARPLWKPMHMQPLFRDCQIYGGQVGEALFRDGLCLPSGSAMTEGQQHRVIETIRHVHARSRCQQRRSKMITAGSKASGVDPRLERDPIPP